MNPYTILGVPPTATDEDIRAAYLRKTKENPPDSAPEKFQQISSAYTKIETEEKRIEHALFNRESPGETPLASVIATRRHEGIRPLPAPEWQFFLRRRAKTS